MTDEIVQTAPPVAAATRPPKYTPIFAAALAATHRFKSEVVPGERQAAMTTFHGSGVRDRSTIAGK